MWALDLGRLVAACFVFAGHASIFFSGPVWISTAPFGLSWFFVLSGFVLACVYAGTPWTAASLRTFYLRRIIRIYPLYLVASLLGLAVLCLLNPGFARSGLAAIGMPGFSYYDLPGDLGGAFLARVTAETLLFVTPLDARTTSRYLLNSPLWSIYCEVFFYLLFPLLLAALRKVPRVPVLLALAFGFWLVQLAAVLAVTEGRIGVTVEWPVYHAAAYTSPWVRLPEFAIGVALGLAYRRTGGRWSAATLWGWLGTGAVAAALILRAAADLGVQPLGHFWLFVPVTAMLVWALAHAPVVRDATERASGEAGLLSYAVYAIHWPMLQLAFAAHLMGAPVAIVLAGAAACAAGFGWLLVRLYETPVRRRLYRLTSVRPASPVYDSTKIPVDLRT